ncbi:MAG: molybdopterin cofactor-binding domain-containing protein [Terracidiphilus sp.]
MRARNAFEREFLEGGDWNPTGDANWVPQVDRRDFLKLFGGGLFIGLSQRSGQGQESGGGFGREALPKEIEAWLHIDADGKVKVFTGKVEVGQNIRTSLAQQVAEELRVGLDTIAMTMGDTALTPFDMGTFGSRTTPTMGPELRTMAAAARQTLVEMAAAKWSVDAATLTAADGRVTDAKNARSVSYGELTRGKGLAKVVSGDPALTPAAEWKIAGTPVAKVNGRDFVTGKHVYPSDVIRPEMLFGAVLRADGFNAALDSVDTSAAEKMAGVKVVRDGDFVGVTAPDSTTAHDALTAIKARWTVPVQPSNANLFEVLRSGTDNGRGRGAHVVGSVEQALGKAEIKLEQQYKVQYIAHAPLEPRAAVAEWDGLNLTVWTGTQRPFGVREELAQALNVPEAQVRVIQPDMGSGYGGKHTGEAAVEAARLARAAGKPVKVEWTRRDEFTWAYFRPAGLIEIRAGARRDGTLLAWECHNYNSGNAGIGTPYDVANQTIQFHPSPTVLRQGSYRSLASTANHFARESHMDAMAHAARMDALEFRLKNLSDARLRAVLQAAAEKFGWGKTSAVAGRGFGIACGTDKGGYVAACAEVEVDQATKRLRVLRVVQAWESGAIVNPDGLRNQNMGAVIQGLGGALFEQILFSNGQILNPLFSEYRVPRFRDAPQVEIVLLDRKDLASAGAGETGIDGVAPAVGNAIFAATGVRLCNLPMAPQTAAPGVAQAPLRS